VQQFFAVLFGGIAQAAVYSIIAVGLSLVYGTARTLNFAYGGLYTTGAYISWVLTVGYLGLPLWLAVLVLIPILFGIGVAIERFMLRPLRSGKNWKITAMMVTLGLAFVLDNANLIIFGAVAKPMPAFIDGTVSIFGVAVSSYRLAVLIIALVIVVALELFLDRTRFGWAVRAVAQDIQGARQVGIDVNRIFSFTFGLSVVLTGCAGLLLSPIFLISPQGGWEPFLKAFVIVVLGGLGSTRGAVVAAFFLGLVEAVVVYKLGANWTMPVWLVTLLLVLMIRPQGLLGRGQTEVAG
jgi:branched-chain amino acid transport system permease protein